MSREKEVCCGKPTNQSRFQVGNGGNKVRVIELKDGAHRCGDCGMIYQAGQGQAGMQESFVDFLNKHMPPEEGV